MRISDWSSDVCSSDLQAEQDEDVAGARIQFVQHPEDLGQRLPRRYDVVRAAFLHQPREGPVLGSRVDRVQRGDPGAAGCAAAVTQQVGGDLEDESVRVLEIGSASCRERVCQYV